MVRLSPAFNWQVEVSAPLIVTNDPPPGQLEAANAGMPASAPNAPRTATVSALRVDDGLPLVFAPSEATTKALRVSFQIMRWLRFMLVDSLGLCCSVGGQMTLLADVILPLYL